LPLFKRASGEKIRDSEINTTFRRFIFFFFHLPSPPACLLQPHRSSDSINSISLPTSPLMSTNALFSLEPIMRPSFPCSLPFSSFKSFPRFIHLAFWDSENPPPSMKRAQDRQLRCTLGPFLKTLESTSTKHCPPPSNQIGPCPPS